MKLLPSFGRNDAIRAIALISVVAFPLIADAQLGLGSKANKVSDDVSRFAGTSVKTAVVSRDSCADQHWPFFSSGCLRGSAEATEPRLVSMNVGSPANSAAIDSLAKAAEATDTVRANAPVTKPKKLVKPRIATHRRERSAISVNYAANSETGPMALAGW